MNFGGLWAFGRQTALLLALFLVLAAIDLFGDVQLSATAELTEVVWTLAMLFGLVRVGQLLWQAIQTLRDVQRERKYLERREDVLDFAWGRVEVAVSYLIVLGYFAFAGIVGLLTPPPVLQVTQDRMEAFRLLALLVGAFSVWVADRTTRRLERRTRRRRETLPHVDLGAQEGETP